MQETQEVQVQSLRGEVPLEGGNGNLLQYSCVKIPMDRGAWWATIQRITESDTLGKHMHLKTEPKIHETKTTHFPIMDRTTSGRSKGK